MFAANVSNCPVSLLIISGNLSVSNHSSPGGVKLTKPVHVNISNGFTGINLVANGWVICAVSEYGNVNKSPVFW